MSDISMAKQDSTGPDGKKDSAPKRGRLDRLRFRKKELPTGLWLKCENCETTIYRKEAIEKAYTCPTCDFHFTMPGRDRVRHTLDGGSWEELFPDLTAMDRLKFVDSGPYGDKIERTVQRTGQNEALIAGRGDILGRPVVLGVMDFKFLGGSMGEVVGEKIALACDVARLERRPLVLFTASGGARMHEGMLSLMQMAKTCSALSALQEAGGFAICVLTHPTTGGVTASFAMVCDLTVAEPGALIGFAGPRVIASTIKQELPPGFQRSEFLLEKGQVDLIVSRNEMSEKLADLIDYGTYRWDGLGTNRITLPGEEQPEEESSADSSSEEESEEE
ncbi:MAG: acetyl-CoA carboxylase, carboxyltransferase subunit beta [Planctomycetota bacterium]